jgi:hypothetical protein
MMTVAMSLSMPAALMMGWRSARVASAIVPPVEIATGTNVSRPATGDAFQRFIFSLYACVAVRVVMELIVLPATEMTVVS